MRRKRNVEEISLVGVLSLLVGVLALFTSTLCANQVVVLNERVDKMDTAILEMTAKVEETDTIFNEKATALYQEIVYSQTDISESIKQDLVLGEVAKVVSTEARGESYTGQCLVAQVIKNRSELWNMSLLDVITAPGQFASHDVPITDSVCQAVFDVFINEYKVVDEPITHFHADYVTPNWASSKTHVITEGVHLFYK